MIDDNDKLVHETPVTNNFIILKGTTLVSRRTSLDSPITPPKRSTFVGNG